MKFFKKNQTFIIAEAGINHNGKLAIAKKLMAAAKKAGADAIKFQAFITDEFIIKDAKKAAHVKGKKSFFDMIKGWELSAKDYLELARFAKKVGIIMFASVFSKNSIRMMQQANAPLFKVASNDLVYHSLLRELAKTGKPMIVSTGMGSLDEVKQAIKILERGRGEIGILHCVSLYPPYAGEFNLQKITILKKLFPQHTIGYSDHSLGIFVPVSSILLGAKIIEKHFTLDKKMAGPDQPSSADPKEFARMVQEIRYLDQAFRPEEKRFLVSPREKNMIKSFRRSLVANVHIEKGRKILESMLAVKRPGTGISPSEINRVIGKRARRDIQINSIIKYSNLR